MFKDYYDHRVKVDRHLHDILLEFSKESERRGKRLGFAYLLYIMIIACIL